MRASDAPWGRPALASRLMWRSSQASASRWFTAVRRPRGGPRGRPAGCPGSRRGAPRPLLAGDLAAGDERGVHLLEHDRRVDDALADVVAAREVVHHVEQHLFEDGPQATRTRAAEQSLVGDRLERV